MIPLYISISQDNSAAKNAIAQLRKRIKVFESREKQYRDMISRIREKQKARTAAYRKKVKAINVKIQRAEQNIERAQSRIAQFKQRMA